LAFPHILLIAGLLATTPAQSAFPNAPATRTLSVVNNLITDKNGSLTNIDLITQLTLLKDPTNDSGGTAQPDDFLLTIGGNPATSGDPQELTPEIPYIINETQQPGYTFVEITDDGSDKCPIALGGTITLAEGDDITCTIVNDDLPRLTLVKDPTNDNGGSAAPDDFLLTLVARKIVAGFA